MRLIFQNLFFLQCCNSPCLYTLRRQNKDVQMPDSEETSPTLYVLLFSQSLLSSFPRMLSLAKLKCSPKTFQFRHNEAAHPLDVLIPAPLLLGNPTPLCWSPKTFHYSLCVKLSFRGGFSRCSTVPYPVQGILVIITPENL